MSNDEREREIGKAVLRARDAQTTIERLSQTLARHADHLQQIAERIAFTVKGTEQRLFASDEVKRLGEGVAYPETFHGNPNSTSEYGLEIPYPPTQRSAKPSKT